MTDKIAVLRDRCHTRTSICCDVLPPTTARIQTPDPSRQVASIFQRFGIKANVRSRGRLDLELRCLVRLGREILRAGRCPASLGWGRRLAAWRQGFHPLSAAVYGHEPGTPGLHPHLYLRDLDWAYHSYRLNGFWNPILTNKLVMANVLAARGVPHPPVLGVVARGRLIPIDADPEHGNQDLSAWMANGRRLVFRPHWSGEGEGVFFLSRDGEAWRINGHAATRAEVQLLIGSLDRYLVTAFVDQAAYARRIQPHTPNTLRILTLADENGPFVASAVHRFGTAASYPIDNFHGGRGLCAAVDVAGERLGIAVCLDGRQRRVEHRHHPQTGERIEGVAIPGLGRALEGVLAAARCLPEAICIGWDVLMRDDGFSVIEANAPPGIVANQTHAPLLADPRAARVFRRHGLGGGRPG